MSPTPRKALSARIMLPLSDLSHSDQTLARETNSLGLGAPQHIIEGKRILIVEDEPLIGVVLTDCCWMPAAKSPALPKAPKGRADGANETIDAALVDGNWRDDASIIVSALRARRIPFAFVTGMGVTRSRRASRKRRLSKSRSPERARLSQRSSGSWNNVVHLHSGRVEALPVSPAKRSSSTPRTSAQHSAAEQRQRWNSQPGLSSRRPR